MFIGDVKPDTLVTISVGEGSQILEFHTEAKEIFQDKIYCAPITQDDKMIGFSTTSLALNLVVPDTEAGRAFQFQNVKIRNIKTGNGDLYHEVNVFGEGKVLNRRGACRVWLGENGVAQIGLSGPTFNVIVKDISISGISFVCGQEQDIPEGSVVHVTFMDEVSKTKFNLGAIIVRTEDMDKGRRIYGCRLNNESSAVAKFVNEKQREKLKKSRQVG